MTNRLKVVEVPSTKTLIKRSPGFAKKQLSDYKLDLLALCGFGCRYCSSNAGNYLRVNRAQFARLAGEQVGRPLKPDDDPGLTYVWPDVLEKLEGELKNERAGFGGGRTSSSACLRTGSRRGSSSEGSRDARWSCSATAPSLASTY